MCISAHDHCGRCDGGASPCHRPQHPRAVHTRSFRAFMESAIRSGTSPARRRFTPSISGSNWGISSFPAFASISLGDVQILLSGPGASGSRPMPEQGSKRPQEMEPRRAEGRRSAGLHRRTQKVRAYIFATILKQVLAAAKFDRRSRRQSDRALRTGAIAAGSASDGRQVKSSRLDPRGRPGCHSRRSARRQS